MDHKKYQNQDDVKKANKKSQQQSMTNSSNPFEYSMYNDDTTQARFLNQQNAQGSPASFTNSFGEDLEETKKLNKQSAQQATSSTTSQQDLEEIKKQNQKSKNNKGF